MSNELKVVEKFFENKQIRTIWNGDEEKFYISVVDIVGVISESDRPRKYWSDLKNKLKQEGNEVSEKIGQLKLKSKDGKYRTTDICDIEEMFRIIESIPSKNSEPIKQWLAKLGSERINEVFDPSLTVQRAIDTYRKKRYPEEWIIRRIKSIQDRKKLTDVWNEHGVTEESEYAILTNEIYKEWSGMTASEYKAFKGLRKESLRDNMSDIEVILSDLGEIATREITKKKNPIGLKQNLEVARCGGNIALNTRKNLENELQESIVTNSNALNYQYMDDVLKIENK